MRADHIIPSQEAVCIQVMDHGFPQFTEAKILSEYIKTDAHKMEVCPFGNLLACLITDALIMRSGTRVNVSLVPANVSGTWLS